MLLKQGEKVVYHIRGNESSGWYYELVPGPDGSVAVNVYPESIPFSKIASLNLRSTFYIVDPGRTHDSCLPKDLFAPKFMLVTSPDETHWGESEFTTNRGKILWGSDISLFGIWRKFYRLGRDIIK
jgi:hypothetical protein